MSVVVVRTHYFDDDLFAWADNLARTGQRVIFVADESTGRVAIPEAYTKITLNEQVVGQLGLATPPRLGWQCGDYALYLARQAEPSAKHLWLIEPDVRINVARLTDFFEFFEDRPDADFVACYFKKAKNSWFWQPSMAPFAEPVYHSLFPLVRASARALDLMLGQRITMSTQFTRERLHKEPYSWPNDESFAATTCMNAGLMCRDVNSFGRRFYREQTFSYVRPHSRTLLESKPADGLIYHPVLTGDRFLQKAQDQFRIRRGRGAPRAFALFDDQFLRELRIECGDKAAVAFKRELSSAIADLPFGPVRTSVEIALYRHLQPLLLRLGVVGQG